MLWKSTNITKEETDEIGQYYKQHGNTNAKGDNTEMS
jgi:hypothetical protein